MSYGEQWEQKKVWIANDEVGDLEKEMMDEGWQPIHSNDDTRGGSWLTMQRRFDHDSAE